MIAESLSLKNYRNYESLNLDLSDGINIFYGDNAQGKTNILESLYVCSTTRSHRGSRDKEMIRFESDEAHIKLIIRKKNVPHKIDIHLRNSKAKGVAIDGIPVKKASDLFGYVNIIFFSPEDLTIIKRGPSERRKFIDSELCQVNKVYMKQLLEYHKVLEQRNALLKELSYSPSAHSLSGTLDVWDAQMVKYGTYIIGERRKFIRQLDQIIKEKHSSLTGGKEKIDLVYEPDTDSERFLDCLFINREKDIRMKTSSMGPHRDDMMVKVNGTDIRKYGSQGQQRTAALSMKLAEIEIVKNIVKDYPILLLDDVLSELDSSRQKFLMESIHDIQTFVTCTGMDREMFEDFPVSKIYQVVQGSVVRQEEIG